MPAKKKATAKKTQTGDQESYYVGITEPLEVRRTILEASKGIIQAMHRYEKFKEYRDEKKELTKILDKRMSELGKLITSLKQIMPKNTVRLKQAREKLLVSGSGVVTKSDDVKVNVQKPVAVSKKSPKKQLSELEKLELELSEIESKLTVISK